MKEECRSFKVILEENLFALIEIRRRYQQLADEGDLVECQVALYLPTQGNVPGGYISLDSRIRFGERVHVFCDRLDGMWGEWQNQQPFRYKTASFVAETWKQAFADAEAYAREELQKLIDALEKRRQALIDAEKEDE